MQPSEKLCWNCGENSEYFQCAGPCKRYQHFTCKGKNNECQPAYKSIVESTSPIPNFYCPVCIDKLPSDDYLRVGTSESANSSKKKSLDDNITKTTLNLQSSTSSENPQKIISPMDTVTCETNETLQKIKILNEKIKSSLCATLCRIEQACSDLSSNVPVTEKYLDILESFVQTHTNLFNKIVAFMIGLQKGMVNIKQTELQEIESFLIKCDRIAEQLQKLEENTFSIQIKETFPSL